MLRAWLSSRSMLVVVVLLGAALNACGAVDSGAPASGGFTDETLANTVAVNADPKGTLHWERSAYEGTAGDVTFVVQNGSGLAHNFGIEGNGVKAVSKTIGAKKTVNLTLKGLAPGEYTIVCTLPGHREAGMVARLTLK
jgi:uncharacterized cupredoxin-like copper-binding protein